MMAIRKLQARPDTCELTRMRLSPLYVLILVGNFNTLATAADPWADTVVFYDPGEAITPGYAVPSTALGPPTRNTSGDSDFGGAVTPFQPPFGIDEIVSIGRGGTLVVAFDEPVEDDPGNPFGIDLLIFNNAFYTMSHAGPDARATTLAEEGGTISVSADGEYWVVIRAQAADSAFPTLSYSDLTAPATLVRDVLLSPGTVPTDFTRPVDPSVSLVDLDILGISAAYDGSGGGVGIDLGPTGLPAITHVRLTNPSDAVGTPEIDALADVAPTGMTCDINGDFSIDAADAGILFSDWGGSKVGDCNRDGVTDAADAGLMFSAWTGDAGHERSHSVPESGFLPQTLLLACGSVLQRKRDRRGRTCESERTGAKWSR